MIRRLVFALLLMTSCRCSGKTAAANNEDLGTLKVPGMAWATVTRQGATVNAAGVSDITSPTPATPDTPFEAASIAKTVIATTVMQLVEEQRLSLDADVSTYVSFASGMTLRHLLSHTSALVDDVQTREKGENIDLAAFLERWFRRDAGGNESIEPPGSSMRYTNIGPSLAAYVVERVTKTKFSERARSHVFLPLKMKAAFGRTNVNAPATAHRWSGTAFIRVDTPSHALYPVVDLFASVSDLSRFAQAILRHGELDGARILEPQSVDEMLRVSFDAAPQDGLGWQHRRFGDFAVVGHEGEDEGASTGLYLDMTRGRGAILLTNGDVFVSGNAARIRAYGDFIQRLLGAEG